MQVEQGVTKEVLDSVLPRLDALAAKLGTTVENLWPALVGQAKVGAGVAIFANLLGIVAALWLLSICKTSWNDKAVDRYNNPSSALEHQSVRCVLPGILGIAGLVGAVLVLCCNLGGWVATFYFPQAEAVKTLSSLLGR